jgi:hypothetical protein
MSGAHRQLRSLARQERGHTIKDAFGWRLLMSLGGNRLHAW